jgi:hypothetical protein
MTRLQFASSLVTFPLTTTGTRIPLTYSEQTAVLF